MSSPLEALSREERRLAQPAGPPRAANVMKAVLTGERFSHPDWIYERKLDVLGRRDDKSAREVVREE